MENIQTPTFINEGEIVLNDENYTIRFSFINNILCTILTYKGETIHNLKDGGALGVFLTKHGIHFYILL